MSCQMCEHCKPKRKIDKLKDGIIIHGRRPTLDDVFEIGETWFFSWEEEFYVLTDLVGGRPVWTLAKEDRKDSA